MGKAKEGYRMPMNKIMFTLILSLSLLGCQSSNEKANDTENTTCDRTIKG